ncbi:alpha-amylase family glycosyl hydrolase [Porphyrobacter sp. GA68]|uniref:alpha-amylase family glycosyl hydrolase n=1 Tax=Porphyrobacter sp. GA68 TaxID=2883480 RepID=UPI001D18F87C|nr:alpha-amylase family glycosyl hydrolase [Porphyrobacter sp. GA68]
MKHMTLAAVAALLSTTACAQTPPVTRGPTVQADSQTFRNRLPQDEIIYFVLPDRFANGDPTNDRGGLTGDRLVTGFDPTHRGFYHGGDLKGLTERLDYIQGLGATAIWFAPVFKNKPVQGPPGQETAGYHGYWITDFTQVDPHFGTNEEFRAFVDAAHARGMKVYMDIITNHTADVIRYREGDATNYAYRSKADYPYSTRGGPDGPRINEGFAGDDVRTGENFARLTDSTYAYTPYVPEAERDVKVPAWLNDPIYYHNRGDTFWVGESSVDGDFVGLDDIFTENPRVVAGMIDIYGDWIDRFGVDGFRIDTAKHVNPEFWQEFVPAMMERARARGIPNFHIFGEIAFDVPHATLAAQVMRESGLPSALDMAFAKAAQLVVSGQASPQVMAELMAQDVIYPGGREAAVQLPTFLGNHDYGRFSMFVKAGNPAMSQDELLARTMLGHAMMLTLRGVPTIYYGDEQGFVSDGNDQLARENMFPSQVAEYNDNDLIGTEATTAQENFDVAHPLYRQIAGLSAVRRSSPALRRGLTQVAGFDHEGPGLLAVERFDADSGERVLVAFNTSDQAIARNVAVNTAARRLSSLAGECPNMVSAPGSVRLVIPPFGYAVCRLER